MTLRPRRRTIPHNRESSAAILGLAGLLALLAFVWIIVFSTPAHSQTPGATYQPATIMHWCGEPGSVPRPIQTSQLPSGPEDHAWWSRRYGPDSNVGTVGLHTTDYEAALLDLGYAATPWAVRDAYCTRDTTLLERAQAVRISGDMSTPFEPGFWSWGRRNWDATAWSVFIQYNAGALVRNLGPADADAYMTVIRLQLELALQACNFGTGPATDPAAGDWRLNKAGACKPTSWTRSGRLSPEWARPVRIDLPLVEPGT